MMNLNSSDIIAISSAVIATLALLATFWQAHIARRHNRLSIQPFLEHRQERIPGQHISVAIINHGLGPALLESVFFTISSNKAKLSIDEFLDHILLAMKPTEGAWETITFQGKSTIPSGREVPLIRLELAATDEENFHIINERLNESTIHIVYRCLYGKHAAYSECLYLA